MTFVMGVQVSGFDVVVCSTNDVHASCAEA